MKTVMTILDQDFLIDLVYEYPVLYMGKNGLPVHCKETSDAWSLLSDRIGYDRVICEDTWLYKRKKFVESLQNRKKNEILDDDTLRNDDHMIFLLFKFEPDLYLKHSIFRRSELVYEESDIEILVKTISVLRTTTYLADFMDRKCAYAFCINTFKKYLYKETFFSKFIGNKDFLLDILKIVVACLRYAFAGFLRDKDDELLAFIKFLMPVFLKHIHQTNYRARMDRGFPGYEQKITITMLENVYVCMLPLKTFYADGIKRYPNPFNIFEEVNISTDSII